MSCQLINGSLSTSGMPSSTALRAALDAAWDGPELEG